VGSRSAFPKKGGLKSFDSGGNGAHKTGDYFPFGGRGLEGKSVLRSGTGKIDRGPDFLWRGGKFVLVCGPTKPEKTVVPGGRRSFHRFGVGLFQGGFCSGGLLDRRKTGKRKDRKNSKQVIKIFSTGQSNTEGGPCRGKAF